MDTSLSISGLASTPLPPVRPFQEGGRPAPSAAGQLESEPSSVTVSISAEARAAEQAARAELPSQAVTGPGAAVRAEAPESGSSQTATDFAVPAEAGLASAEPDAASAASRPAIQLFLENAASADAPPATSPIRASA